VRKVVAVARERNGGERRKIGKAKKSGGSHIWRGMEGLQEWRLGEGIWRGMQNGGVFRGTAGVVFLHQTSKFWSRGPYGGLHWRCS
jgi:hypothetical protein